MSRIPIIVALGLLSLGLAGLHADDERDDAPRPPRVRRPAERPRPDQHERGFPLPLENGRADLLEFVDLRRDALKADWRFDADGRLIVPVNSRLVLPYDLPDEYVLRLDVERLPSPGGPFLLVVRRGGAVFGLVLCAWSEEHGHHSGLQRYECEELLPASRRRHRKNPLTAGKHHTIVVRITDRGVRVRIDGKRTLRWRRGFNAFAAPHAPPVVRSLMFTSNRAKFAISGATLKRLDRRR